MTNLFNVLSSLKAIRELLSKMDRNRRKFLEIKEASKHHPKGEEIARHIDQALNYHDLLQRGILEYGHMSHDDDSIISILSSAASLGVDHNVLMANIKVKER